MGGVVDGVGPSNVKQNEHETKSNKSNKIAAINKGEETPKGRRRET